MDATAALVSAAITDYEVLRVLGEGPTARCYLARPPARNGAAADAAEQVAVKVFTTLVTEQAFDRAVRELRAVAAVGSPHVAQVFDAVLKKHFAYVMEYFPLGSLADPALPPTQVPFVGGIACSAQP